VRALGIVAFLVLYQLIAVLLKRLSIGQFGVMLVATQLVNWREASNGPCVRDGIRTPFLLVIALALIIALAWGIVRINVPEGDGLNWAFGRPSPSRRDHEAWRGHHVRRCPRLRG
jgi:hypothetical protein